MTKRLLTFLLLFSLSVFSNDGQILAKGKWYFKKHCAYCHGKEAQGELAPNLTDEFFIYGAQKEVINAIVRNGVPDKGMPAWKEIVTKDDQLTAIIEYVYSIRGKKLKGKEAQGQKVDLKELFKKERQEKLKKK